MTTHHRLSDADMGTALQFIGLKKPALPIAVFHNGKRFGGFRVRAHAEWFIEKNGMAGAEIVENYIDGPKDTWPGNHKLPGQGAFGFDGTGI